MISSVVLGWRRVGSPDVVADLLLDPVGRDPREGEAGQARRRGAGPLAAIFVELGVLSNRQLIRLLERLELATYCAADAVAVVSGSFRLHTAARRIGPSRIHTIRNGVDETMFRSGCVSQDQRQHARRRLGASDIDVLVLYIGAYGISHELTHVADVAAQLAGQNIRFAFYGQGAAKSALRGHVANPWADGRHYSSGRAEGGGSALLDGADICLVPLRDVALFDRFIPSKLFDYLAAGKAVVGSIRGEAARILSEARAVVVGSEDRDALAGSSREPCERQLLGALGRACAEPPADRADTAMRYRGIIRQSVLVS